MFIFVAVFVCYGYVSEQYGVEKKEIKAYIMSSR